ncbi:MAG: D-glycero-alpha-D-manno-heptose-1,7-bisphosphate 7-phosphatase [Solirubrobacteraceae bacterium]
MSQAAAFIDRDGVVNALIRDPQTGRPESPLRAQDVVLIEGAAAALRTLAAAGLLLVGVSNQPAAAKGNASQEELEAVQQQVLGLLVAGGVRFDGFKFCLHHPDGVLAELTIACDCRKPAPGMLLDAAHELEIDLRGSWMVGDTDSDILAGAAAGCRTVLVEHPGSTHKRTGSARPDFVAPTIEAAATLIVQADRVD